MSPPNQYLPFELDHFSTQKQMIELCRTTGQKLLFEGKYESAVPAALAALKFAIQVYGLSSIELVPSYLILGEASIGEIHSWLYVNHKFASRVVLLEYCF